MTSAAAAVQPAALAHRRRRIRPRRLALLRVPDRDGTRLVVPARVGHLHRAEAVLRHAAQRLHLAALGAEHRELHQRMEPGGLPPALPQLADCRGTGGHRHADRRVDGGVCRFALQLAVQPPGPHAVHRRQPPAAAGHHRAAVPAVPAAAAPAPRERQRTPVRPVPRASSSSTSSSRPASASSC